MQSWAKAPGTNSKWSDMRTAQIRIAARITFRLFLLVIVSSVTIKLVICLFIDRCTPSRIPISAGDFFQYNVGHTGPCE